MITWWPLPWEGGVAASLPLFCSRRQRRAASADTVLSNLSLRRLVLFGAVPTLAFSLRLARGRETSGEEVFEVRLQILAVHLQRLSVMPHGLEALLLLRVAEERRQR